MAWLEADALLHFRRLLGDLPTDKFTFKSQVVPSADGTTKVFHTGDQNLLSGSVKIYVNGALRTETTHYTVDLTNGVIEFLDAFIPTAGQNIEATYHYQWFTDAQLLSFLTGGSNVIGVELITSDDLIIGMRPAACFFACYYAYMKKAGEHADSLEASAEGFTANQGKSFPNWKRMAENAWAQGKDAVDFYNENVLAVGGIGMAIVSYRMPDYLPRS